jgi:hypothetical protein
MNQSHSIQERREQACGPRRKRPRHRRPVVAPEVLEGVPRAYWAATASLYAEVRRHRRDPETFVGLSSFGVTCPACHDTRRFFVDGLHDWMCSGCFTHLSKSEVAAVWAARTAYVEATDRADAAAWAFAHGDPTALEKWEKGAVA